MANRQERMDDDMANNNYCEHCGQTDISLIETADGKTLCEECIEALDYAPCDDCGTFVPCDELRRTAYGEDVCEDCAEENYVQCDDCGTFVPRGELRRTAYGEDVCESCAEENYTPCDDCGDLIYADEIISVNDGDRYVCESCAEDYAYCDDCGALIYADEIISANDGDRYVCEDCAARHYFTCNHCGNTYSSYYIAGHDTDDEPICEACAGRHYYICDSCGCYVVDYGARWDEDTETYYCPDCYADRRRPTIHDYGYKPVPYIHMRSNENNSAYTFGVELEIDKGEDRLACAADLNEIANDVFYLKYDGSLSNGIEIVTHPATLAYHQYQLRWKEICKTAHKHGFLSHDAGTCGLHIHVGREPLGADRAERDTTIAKTVLLVNRHWDPLVKFSRRAPSQLSSWANRPNIRPYNTAEEAVHNALSTQGDGRYQAVNLMLGRTIEFRLFRGSLKRDTIIASLQLVSNICKYAQSHTVEDVLASNWSDLLTIEAHKELEAYCESKGLTTWETPTAQTVASAPQRAFRVGDRVVVVNRNGDSVPGIRPGMTGTVCYICPSSFDYGVAFDDDFAYGHAINGSGPRNGYWLYEENIAPLDESPRTSPTELRVGDRVLVDATEFLSAEDTREGVIVMGPDIAGYYGVYLPGHSSGHNLDHFLREDPYSGRYIRGSHMTLIPRTSPTELRVGDRVLVIPRDVAVNAS